MKIHFNSIGIITNVQTDGDSLRQGSVGTALEATFEGINNNYYSAKLNFTRSDGTSISNVAMLWDSENTETFKFVFDDSWFFALSGATTITVFLYDAKGKVIANGQYRFYIEPTDYNEEPTITINQFNALMTALAGKVGVPTSSVFVSELPEKGESGVFYVVREGENKNNIYVYNANTEDYVWVGTIDLKLDNYTTKIEQAVFEKGINNQVAQIRGEVINPFDVVETVSQLPLTNQNKLYIVKETNAWYYWNGTQYVDGGAFIDSGITIENLEGQFSELGQALYDYIETRFNNGDHKPFMMIVNSVENWQGNEEQVQPYGNSFGWYDNDGGDVIIITNAGIFALDNTYKTRPIVNYNFLAERVIYDNTISDLQATTIQEAIDLLQENKATITTETGVNKIDLNKVILGAFLGQSGAISTYTGIGYTDFIKIKTGDVVVYRKCILSGSNQQGCYYDNNFNFVGGIKSSNSTSSVVNEVDVISFISPIDGYVRINFDESALNRIMLVINADYPTTYIPFSKTVTLMPLKLSVATNESLENIFFPEHEFVNLFNGSYESGKFIDRQGNIYTAGGYAATDYVPVQPGQKLIVRKVDGYNFSYVICLFNENYEVVTQYANVTPVVSNGLDCWLIEVTNLDVVKYARFTCLNPQDFMIIKGETYPTHYVPYNAEERLINNNYKLNTTQIDQVRELSAANNLYGKKMACCGDSIMESRTTGEKPNGGAWAGIIGTKNSMVVNNIAVSGSRLSDTAEGRTPIYAALQTLQDEYDYLCFDGGVNDFASNVSLGEITTDYDSDISNYDKTTILGGLEALCSLLVFNYQTAKKLFVFNHRIYRDTATATAGTWGNLITKMKECLEKWGIPYIDLEKEAAPINLLGQTFKDTYTTLGDGWHPNELGYRTFYVDKIEAKLKEL